jgi:HD-GYP domain-containing protein (c-di-GMP phosphodiesterase class II)
VSGLVENGQQLRQPGEAAPECPAHFVALRRRLRDAGMLLVGCSPSGEITQRPPRGEDWLCDFFCGSEHFVRAVRRAAAKWSSQEIGLLGPVQAMPGVWLAPVAILNRRRLAGYSVAVIVTDAFIGVPGGADAPLRAEQLAQLPVAAESEVARLGMLVRYLHEDGEQLAMETARGESTGRQLAESYEEISLLYTIIQSMTEVQQPERFVEIACEELLGTLPYAWIGAQFAADSAMLKHLAGRLIGAGHLAGASGDGRSISAARLRTLTGDLLALCAEDIGSPVVLEPTLPGTRPEHSCFAELGRTVLVHPVSSDGELIGALIAAEKHGESEHDIAASSVDMKLIGATASHMAIFLKNAALYDDLNAMFLGTLEALTASIDAKDRYTCGHSRRVAHLTAALAHALGMAEAPVRRMHIAGLVHDVGKIGVPERVLLKPGRLSDDEFAWIRQHPEIGYRILKAVPQIEDVLPGVLHHHERWDGHGYPHGLAGEEIPLVARLIALADSFDAMSSTRTYRSALDRRQVLSEIRRCAGTQFDPALVPLFMALDFREYDRMVEEHRAGDMNDLDHRGRPRGVAA